MVIRDCHIRIDREGNWFYNNSPVTNRNVWLYFTRHIAKDKQGNYVLKTETQVLPVEVEDTPFIVKHFNIINQIHPIVNVSLNDNTEEVVAWDNIWLKDEKDIYCLIKDGVFEARFNRDSQFELGDRLQFDQHRKRYYLAVKGEKFYLAHRE
jgi:hypothetical protein